MVSGGGLGWWPGTESSSLSVKSRPPSLIFRSQVFKMRRDTWTENDLDVLMQNFRHSEQGGRQSRRAHPQQHPLPYPGWVRVTSKSTPRAMRGVLVPTTLHNPCKVLHAWLLCLKLWEHGSIHKYCTRCLDPAALPCLMRVHLTCRGIPNWRPPATLSLPLMSCLEYWGPSG